MIVTTLVLDQVDCKGIFTPIFQAIDERLIQASPQVTEVKMVISSPEGLGFHESPLDHMEETDSLLYTKSKFEDYNENLHASRSRKAIQTAMTRKYCAKPASCGSYQPSEPGTFNLESLVDDIEDELDWKQWLANYVQTWGQFAAIIMALVWTIKIGAKLLAVISVRNQGFTWKTALHTSQHITRGLQCTTHQRDGNLSAVHADCTRGSIKYSHPALIYQVIIPLSQLPNVARQQGSANVTM